MDSSVKTFILNGNKQGEYVRNVVVGYSDAYPTTNIKVMVFSEMMYFVTPINRITQTWKGDRKIDFDPVRVCIEEKEKKLIEYKQKCAGSVEQWWLCIEVPEDAHINPSSYVLPENFDSGYDKIFIVTTACPTNIRIINNCPCKNRSTSFGGGRGTCFGYKAFIVFSEWGVRLFRCSRRAICRLRWCGRLWRLWRRCPRSLLRHPSMR